MATKLASLHKPVTMDYRLKFCLDKRPEPPTDSACRPNCPSLGDHSI